MLSAAHRRTIVLSALTLLVAALVWWWLSSSDDGTPDPVTSPSPSASATAGASPTPTGTTGTEALTTTVTTAPPAATTAPTTTAPLSSAAEDTRADVEVVVTYAGWNTTSAAVEVGAYVGAVEEGGTCALVLSDGSTRVSVSSAAAADASTTSCGALSVPGDRLTSGTWSAEVTYTSAALSGTADPVTVEIP